MLKNKFVVGWKNIRDKDYVGSSHGYTCKDSAVGTTNGAGPRNMQTFILSSNGTVLHCLPGFWHPEDLAYELEFGLVMERLFKDKRSANDKRALFARMHERAIREQSKEMIARSGWQGFDAGNERNRLKQGKRDTFYYDDEGKPTGMKPLSVLLHERMATRPFKKIGSFDTEAFIDYGRPYYDNNAGVSGMGANFGTKGYMESQKRMEARRKRRAEEKARRRAYYGSNPRSDDERKARRKKSKEKESRKTAKKKKKKARRRATSRPSSRPARTRS